jgi:hypothetical protein
MLVCPVGLALRRGDREELPVPRDRAEFVDTVVGERDSGSDDQVLDGPETRISAGCAWAVTRRTISTEIPDLVAGQVHFPRVDPGA